MIAMQDRRISFDDLCLGLAKDREYGTGCEELLNKTLARHGLTTKNFPGPVNTLFCHNHLVRIWLGYEELPFYYCGKEQPVRFDLDNITPRTFLEEIELPEIEVRRLDLAHFLFMQDLPLPAPDVKDKTIWFHGQDASTEFYSLNSDPYGSVDEELWDLLMEKKELEEQKLTWTGLNADKPSEKKIQEEKLEEIDRKLEKINAKIDAGSSGNGQIEPKKLLPCQRHRKAVQDIAEKIWSKEPDLTIVDMSKRSEIIHACEKKIYSERTLRKWMKELCPNRNPGRRPKKKIN